MMIDYPQLGAELLRALRGKRSQRALGRRMRFTSNVLYAWESGRRQPTASVFFRLAASVGVDFGARLQHVLFGQRRSALSSKRLATAEGVAELLRTLAQDQTVSALARGSGVDRTTVTRWLRGHSEPRLPELLRFVELTTLRLLDVIEVFADPAALPAARARYRNLQAQRRLAFDLPLSHAVLRALELHAYQKGTGDDAAFVAQRVGIAPSEAAELLRALASAGQIRKRHGRYAISDVMTVDTRLDSARDVRLKRYWAEVGVARIDAQRIRGDALASYNLFAASNEAYARIRKLHLDYYDAVRRIVAEDTSPDRVVLLNLQLFPLDA